MKLERLQVQSRLTNYIPLPRSVLQMKLPVAAVVLYAMLLDRGTLSQKNGYSDPAGWVYVVYPQEELAQELSISTRMIRRYVQILEEAGLLRRHRAQRKSANRYYLFIPGDSVGGTGTGTGSGQFLPLERPSVSGGTGSGFPPNNRKKQHNPNILYQHNEQESL